MPPSDISNHRHRTESALNPFRWDGLSASALRWPEMFYRILVIKTSLIATSWSDTVCSMETDWGQPMTMKPREWQNL